MNRKKAISADTAIDINQTPDQHAEYLIAWYDTTLRASLWMDRKRIPPYDAAMLLCRHDPKDRTTDPGLISTDETTTEDFHRLLVVFEDEGPQGLPLIDWLEIAKANGLKFHSWITAYLAGKKRTNQNIAQARPNAPCVTKHELIDGLNLTDAKWEEILRRPGRDGKRYESALVSKGKRGRAPGGGSHQSQWNPIVFTRLAVERKDLSKAQAIARFKKAWPQWQDELTAEMGLFSG